MHPTLLHIGHLYVPTFGLLAALGLLAGLLLSLRLARVARLDEDAVWNAGLFAIFAAFVLSRALLVILNLRSFLTAPVLLLMVPSLTALGLALTVVATVLYLRRARLPLLPTLDVWAAPGALLWGFLALGHLAEGSDPGLPATFGLRTSLAGYREHPVALYAAAAAMLLAAFLVRELLRRRQSGRVAAEGLVLAGVTQFLLTFLRLPYLYEAGSRWTMLDPLQWVALAMVAVGAGLLLRARPAPAIHHVRSMHAFGREL